MVEFGVLAAFAGDMDEFLVLDIQEFTEKTACGTDFACFVGVVPAFGAGKVDLFAHFSGLILFFRSFEGWDSFILALFNSIAKLSKGNGSR